MVKSMILDKLSEKDYLNKDDIFWKNYRKKLTESLNDDQKIEKTIENISSMAKEIGIKPTARYFDISPAIVRNYIKS